MTPRDPGKTNWSELNLFGESPAFQRVLALLPQLARVDATVLLRGETGTGKELAARAIHYLSPRAGGPFVPVNCAAIPEALLEAELFGHVRGAYTDARSASAGLIAHARGGTLFLDEIDALSAHGQAAILRFVQDGCFRPVGAAKQEHADVRIVVATNTDLAARCEAGLFRLDLLYRLNLLCLDLPALRERAGDAVLLARAFVDRLARQYRVPARRLGATSVTALAQPRSWPGNVRELEHLVHRSFLLCEGDTIELGLARADPASAATSADTTRPAAPGQAPAAAAPAAGSSAAPAHASPEAAPGSGPSRLPFAQSKALAIAAFERSYVADLLTQAQGNLSLAARLAGKERSRFGKLVKKYDLHRNEFGGD